MRGVSRYPQDATAHNQGLRSEYCVSLRQAKKIARSIFRMIDKLQSNLFTDTY